MNTKQLLIGIKRKETKAMLTPQLALETFYFRQSASCFCQLISFIDYMRFSGCLHDSPNSTPESDSHISPVLFL